MPIIKDKPSWAQTIEDTKLVRIAKEAIKQGGVLSSSVASGLLGIKQVTISKHVREYCEREKK